MPLASRVLVLLGATSLSLAALGCGGTPPPPFTPSETPPPASGPGITCPADATVDATGTTTPVSYSPPVVTGGTAPFTTTCTLASGSALAPGVTDVICTVRDGLSRSASCSFRLTVNAVHRLRGTRFMTFGDSITDGETAPGVNFEDDKTAYPEILRQLLVARYRLQSIHLDVKGVYGRTAAAGADDLRSLLATNVPDALLILEGVNDINSGAASSIGVVKDALRSDVRRAKAAGVKMVFVSTLLPQLPGFRTSGQTSALIEPMNAEIRAVAASEGAVLVDNHAALIGQARLYIGDDGLHPTVEGHRKIAETFFEAIKNNFEEPLPATPASVRRR